jgi:hypothetical protein
MRETSTQESPLAVTDNDPSARTSTVRRNFSGIGHPLLCGLCRGGIACRRRQQVEELAHSLKTRIRRRTHPDVDQGSVRHAGPVRKVLQLDKTQRPEPGAQLASGGNDGVHAPDVIAFDNPVNPYSINAVGTLPQREISVTKFDRSHRMAHLIDSNATLWQNVQALMLKKFGKVNLLGFAKHCDIGLATVQRIKAQETSVGIAVLDKIAEKFDLASWQLLVPGMDPANPPVLKPDGATERKIYEKVMSVAKEIAADVDTAAYLKK